MIMFKFGKLFYFCWKYGNEYGFYCIYVVLNIVWFIMIMCFIFGWLIVISEMISKIISDLVNEWLGMGLGCLVFVESEMVKLGYKLV